MTTIFQTSWQSFKATEIPFQRRCKHCKQRFLGVQKFRLYLSKGVNQLVIYRYYGFLFWLISTLFKFIQFKYKNGHIFLTAQYGRRQEIQFKEWATNWRSNSRKHRILTNLDRIRTDSKSHSNSDGCLREVKQNIKPSILAVSAGE